jgi:NAD(P)-dependent dehydrogenase (short-subunit alcohol dehydrogenase family)
MLLTGFPPSAAGHWGWTERMDVRRHREVELRGRVVAITGAGRGIGLATAVACRSAGMKVGIGDLDEALAGRAAESVGGETVGLALDVTDADSFRAFLDAVEAQLGPLGVLVNNAGVFTAGPYQSEPDEVTRRLLAANVLGCALGSKLAIQRFLSRGDGHLVNMASIGAVVPTAGASSYSASKHAVLGLTRSLRWELAGTGVRATVVMPGVIDTEMTASMPRPRGLALPPVPASAVGDAVVSALRSGKPEVFVPAAVTPLARILSMLGPRTGDAIKRATGLHKMLMNQDQELAAKYQARVDAEYSLGARAGR